MFSFLFSCSGDHRDLPSFPTRRSSDLISPPLGSSNPATMRSVVVLPQPDGPTSTTNSPSSIARLTLFTAATAPNDLLKLTSSMRAKSFSLEHDLVQRPVPVFRDHAQSPHY